MYVITGQFFWCVYFLSFTPSSAPWHCLRHSVNIGYWSFWAELQPQQVTGILSRETEAEVQLWTNSVVFRDCCLEPSQVFGAQSTRRKNWIPDIPPSTAETHTHWADWVPGTQELSLTAAPSQSGVTQGPVKQSLEVEGIHESSVQRLVRVEGRRQVQGSGQRPS